MDFEKIKDDALAYEKSLIEEYRSSILPENLSYFVSLEDCYGRELNDDFKWLYDACDRKNPTKILELCKKYEQSAHDYAADWFDEDLGIVRSGYAFEAEVYRKLSDICKC